MGPVPTMAGVFKGLTLTPPRRFQPRIPVSLWRSLAVYTTLCFRADVSAISWRSQQRLHTRLGRIMARRGKPKALAAVARELCGYLWEIAVWVRAQAAADPKAHAS